MAAETTTGSIHTSRTTLTGEFVLVAPQGCYALNYTAPGYISPRTGAPRYSLSPGQSCDVGDLRLRQGTTISGLVTDEEDRPVIGVSVFAFATGARQPHFAITDTCGHYQLGVESYRQYRLWARSGTLTSEVSLPVAVRAECVVHDIQLTTGCRISGILRDERGRELAGQSVHCSSQCLTMFTTTASDGSFTISNLPSGTYQVTAQYQLPDDNSFAIDHAGQVLLRQKCRWAAHADPDPLEFSVRLNLEGGVGGRIVSSEGAPIVGAQLRLQDSDGVAATTVSDANGRFLLFGLLEPQYELIARGEFHQKVHAGTHDLEISISPEHSADENSGEIDNVNDHDPTGSQESAPDATLWGFVFDHNTGLPIENAQIFSASESSDKCTISGTNGEFPIEEGTTHIHADHIDYARSPVVPVDRNGETQLPMVRGTLLRGSIRRENAEATAQIRLTLENGIRIETMTDQDGNYSVRATPGRANVAIVTRESFGKLEHWRTLSIPNKNEHVVNMSLPPRATRVFGWVTRSGIAVPHFELCIMVQTDDFTVGGIPIRTRTDQDGRYEFPSLPSGHTELYEYPTPESSLDRETLASQETNFGEDARVDVELGE